MRYDPRTVLEREDDRGLLEWCKCPNKEEEGDRLRFDEYEEKKIVTVTPITSNPNKSDTSETLIRGWTTKTWEKLPPLSAVDFCGKLEYAVLGLVNGGARRIAEKVFKREELLNLLETFGQLYLSLHVSCHLVFNMPTADRVLVSYD